MNLHKEKILAKIHELKDHQIEHLIQMSRDEIENYKFGIRNYDEEKMKNFGAPFLAELEKFNDELMAELGRRTG
jgi:threonyl-tRNA synthetase